MDRVAKLGKPGHDRLGDIDGRGEDELSLVLVFASLGASELIEQAKEARQGEKAEDSISEKLGQGLERPVAGDGVRKLLICHLQLLGDE